MPLIGAAILTDQCPESTNFGGNWRQELVDKTHRPVSSRATGWRRLVSAGESPVAMMGAAVVVIVLLSLASASWWCAASNNDVLRRVREAQLQALASTLGQAAETMLTSNDVSALRRLVVEAKRDWDLEHCRVRLSNGGIIADAEPARITVASLAPGWTATPVDDRSMSAESPLFVSQALRIAGRGGATLELAAADVADLRWIDVIGPIGLIAAAAMAVIFLVYHRTREQLAPLGMIRDALLARGSGERAAGVLAVSATAGPEAAAWNELVSDIEEARRTYTGSQARQALTLRAQSHGMLEQACDALSLGLLILDEQGQVTFSNGAAGVFLQSKRESIVGQAAESFIAHAGVKEALQRATAGGTRQRQVVEIEQSGAGGTAVLRFGVRPISREQASGALVTIEDVTQQRNAEASRNSFIAQATHELRTPLTNIALYLEMAQDAGENDPSVRAKCLNVIGQESRRLERTVGEMLSVAQIEAGSLELKKDDVRLDKLFAELEADYRAQADEKQQQLKFDLPPKMPVIQADPSKFAATIHNLVGNALKYTPAGGAITVALRVEKQSLCIDVTDTGIGIDEKEQELIFARFYRAKDPRVGKITGSGLGLALAREVARLHGGDVTVQSRINKGSTFTLTLPLDAAAG